MASLEERAESNLKIPSCVLITGANSGCGFDCARQLALIDGVNKIYLACRSLEKSESAKQQLEELTNTSKFEVLAIDVSSLESVRAGVEQLENEPVIDGVVLNAGGAGGNVPSELMSAGVTVSMAANLLGHVLLIDELIIAGKIAGKAATVIYAGSESARGIPAMSLKPPNLETGSVEEFISICDGSFFTENEAKNPKYMGGHAKFVGALWISSMARKHPEIRFITVSPGATTGTNARRTLPWYKRAFVGALVNLQSLVGLAHSVDIGAKRYIDALLDHENYQSGIFYGSKKGLSGEMGDQAVFLDYFANGSFQDNANEALHNFIKTAD
ncbi:light-dependent protochlorophyllide reductase-like [Clytia hemisphaerica]|uniref:Short-chain dehydrogenase n=1 Tax=Clytia hemisphaerica TaxID=252671 RepID=A0A7M5WSW2_9CNID